MPLWLLGTFVVVGLTAIWVILRLYGFTRNLVLTPELAAQEFATDNPGLVAQDVTLAQSGQAALIRSGGSLYVLWVMGLDTASHALIRAEVREAEGGLKLRLHDFAAPRLTLSLTQDEARDWRRMIEEAA